MSMKNWLPNYTGILIVIKCVAVYLSCLRKKMFAVCYIIELVLVIVKMIYFYPTVILLENNYVRIRDYFVLFLYWMDECDRGISASVLKNPFAFNPWYEQAYWLFCFRLGWSRHMWILCGGSSRDVSEVDAARSFLHIQS